MAGRDPRAFRGLTVAEVSSLACCNSNSKAFSSLGGGVAVGGGGLEGGGIKGAR